MNEPRQLSEAEYKLISGILARTPAAAILEPQLTGLRATEMDDGGMGSLTLVPTTAVEGRRVMGSEVVEAKGRDADGTPLIISINTDKEGSLFELDIWRVDFNPLIRLPDPADLIIPTPRDESGHEIG